MQSSLESISLFEVYRDGGYIQVVEDCAKEIWQRLRRR